MGPRIIRSIRSTPWDPSVHTYHAMAEELFENVRMLYEQLDAQFGDARPAEERVGSQMSVSNLRIRYKLPSEFY
jgi:hypothetical protein